jgi:hypothetical protein
LAWRPRSSNFSPAALRSAASRTSPLFLAENRPVTELAREGHARVVIAEGVAQLHAALTTPRPDWPNRNRPEERQK